MNWGEFFAMGGYGKFIWSAYGATAIIMILNIILPIRRHKKILRMLQELLKMKERD